MIYVLRKYVIFILIQPTNNYTYIYIYIKCVCVCVWGCMHMLKDISDLRIMLTDVLSIADFPPSSPLNK
jgi:hypothetical protein